MKIIVSTGGSGGHIFPGLKTAQVLRAKGHEVTFVGSLGLGYENIKTQGFKAINIHAQGLTNKSLKGFLNFGLIMMKALSEARNVLLEEKPDKVIGFGGYGSFAVVVAASILRIPVMIHEQNVVPGKANRLLSKFVKKLAISFQETSKYFDPKKTIWTGCPCQNNSSTKTKEALFQQFSLEPHKRTILVLGGSQGSQKINEIFFNMMCSLGINDSIQAIHMTGKKDFPVYEFTYKQKGIPVKVLEFISPIEEAYAIADLVIARAGAVTVSELGFFLIPSILIPYPLADGHQKYNAEVLASCGLSKVIEQKDLSVDVLRKEIESILLQSKATKNSQVKERFKDNSALELAIAVENL